METVMLCIKNGKILTESGVSEDELWVDKGVIIEKPESYVTGAEIYDAKGNYVLPGFIDAHTHLEMTNSITTTADDYESGTAAALAGGTTTVIDFATQDRGGSLNDALEAWMNRAKGNCSCDYAFHMAVTDWNGRTKVELSDMVKAGVTSFKAYMAYRDLMLRDDELAALLREAGRLGCVVGSHCELGEEVEKGVSGFLSHGKTGPRYHPLSRPADVEAGAVRRFLELASESDSLPWVVHLSTASGLGEIRSFREKGRTVLTETCPQYFSLNDDVYSLPGFEGAKYVCSPPIRGEEHRRAIESAVAEGEIDIVSTDHCAYRFAGQKDIGRDDFSKIPNGLPGIEHRAVLLWELVKRGELTVSRFSELLSKNPAVNFGMYPKKGCLSPGSDADIVIWDPDCVWTIDHAKQLMNTDYSPWEGKTVHGKAGAVFLRGVLCSENGEIIRRGLGRFVPRKCRLS